MRTTSAYWPLVFGVGALLPVIGWGLKRMTYDSELKRWGDDITNYGVIAIALAIALWPLLRFLEAYESGLV